jgi:ComF family protein
MWSDFLDMLFPSYCQMCEAGLAKGEKVICIYCRYHLPLANYHLLESNPLEKRFMGKVHIRYAWAYLKFTKQGRVQKALHALKYKGKQEVGQLMGIWYGEELRKSGHGEHFDLILPVPLHPSKLKKRGYNQSDTFASGLSEALATAWSPNLLIRTAASSTQTRKRRFERWKNVESIFGVSDLAQIKDKRILLVDDVITTGATLEACVEVLQEAGCREVSIAAIAAAQ